jgi:AGCS family alanine or glycine:cation symporter
MVILGGIQRLAKFASIIVPFKALLYLGTAFIILAMNYTKLLPALQLMIESAFNLHSVTGGFLGYAILKAISTGFERGIFATDAGTGIVPILQASARTSNPVIDGIATLVAPFLVMIVCTTTGLVLIVTETWRNSQLQSTNMVTQAFESGLHSPFGAWIVVISLILFAYTTILAWAYCGEKALGFLKGTKYAKHFRYIYIALIPVGTLIHVDVVWALADVAISLMLMTNMIGIIGLSQSVINDSRSFTPETT